MSKVFYDQIVDLSEVEKAIKKNIKDKETQEEIFHLIDEIVHHRIVGCILDRLPDHHHEEFVDKVVERPHDHNIIDFLKKRAIEDVEAFIKYEAEALSRELMQMLEEEKKAATKTKK